MGLLHEAKLLIKSILSWVYLLVGFVFFFFAFGLKEVAVFGKAFILPMPTLNSFAGSAISTMRENLLPEGVELIVTNPLSAFLAQILVALLMAFILTFPFLLYKAIGYLSPALLAKEKKAVLLAVFPSALLFFSGCAFAYFFIIPATFKFLYPYTVSIGAIPFFSVNEFVAMTFGIMVAVGVMFLLPIFMALLNFSGIVGPRFWRDNWRYALVTFLIFSAIITPDGTGISMMMLVVPLAGLYIVGAFVGRR